MLETSQGRRPIRVLERSNQTFYFSMAGNRGPHAREKPRIRVQSALIQRLDDLLVGHGL